LFLLLDLNISEKFLFSSDASSQFDDMQQNFTDYIHNPFSYRRFLDVFDMPCGTGRKPFTEHYKEV
jgi:hypothetical protein